MQVGYGAKGVWVRVLAIVNDAELVKKDCVVLVYHLSEATYFPHAFRCGSGCAAVGRAVPVLGVGPAVAQTE